MPSKVQLYAQMADRTAEQITGSYQKWTAFLTTAARLYKYPYNEQLMIFAQRPEATACAEYDLWNKQMRRYVRRGSKGIALVDTSSDQPKLRYVFDVSDTSGGENSRRPYLWEYRQEHREVVSAALEQRFDVSGENGLADQMERVAAQLVDEYWHDNWRDIVGIVDGSFLEGYDEFNIGAAFRNAAVVSTTYALLSRCGMQPGDYFEHEDFLNVFDFNTPQTVAALGTAISQSSELVRSGDNGLILADGASPSPAALQSLRSRGGAIALANHGWVQQHAMFGPGVAAFLARLRELPTP